MQFSFVHIYESLFPMSLKSISPVIKKWSNRLEVYFALYLANLDFPNPAILEVIKTVL